MVSSILLMPILTVLIKAIQFKVRFYHQFPKAIYSPGQQQLLGYENNIQSDKLPTIIMVKELDYNTEYSFKCLDTMLTQQPLEQKDSTLKLVNFGAFSMIFDELKDHYQELSKQIENAYNQITEIEKKDKANYEQKTRRNFDYTDEQIVERFMKYQLIIECQLKEQEPSSTLFYKLYYKDIRVQFLI